MSHAVQYDFPSKSGKKPMSNQKLRFDFWLSHRHAFDLSEMGTGKTLTAAWAADYITREAGGAVLILAPLSILRLIWQKELHDVFGALDNHFVILDGPVVKRVSEIVKNGHRVYVTNYESLLSPDFVAAVQNSTIHTILIDEVTAFKHADTSRSKALRRMREGLNIWGMTATPMPNTPLNAHGIARAVRTDYTESFTRFRDRTHNRVSMWKWVPLPKALQEARAVLQPSIRVTRDECTELPPCTSERRLVTLSKEAKGAYKALRAKLRAEIDGKKIGAAHEAALRNKLLQVCGGAVYASEGEDEFGRAKRSVAQLNPGGRAKELLDIHDQTDEKIVIFAPFRSHLELIDKLLKSNGISCAMVHGDVSPRQRAEAVISFQELPYPRTLIADPRCMAHGVELFRGSVITWWLPVDSAELYEQAQGRLTRRGQTRHVRNIQLCGSPLEAAMYDRLALRQGMQGALLQTLTMKGT
jgi:SNF2 family DNA or RNA helicase